MAISQLGSATFYGESTTAASSYDMSHTVTANTTLLIIAAAVRANRSFTSATWNTSESGVLIQETTTDNLSGSCDVAVWGIVSPTATTANVSVVFNASNEPFWIAAVNYDGTVTTSVAAATNYLSADINDVTNGATNTSVHASGGNSGNALLFVGGATGDDMIPASNNASFNETIENNTGGAAGNATDLSCYIAHLLTGLPSGITTTWGETDENASLFIELVAAGGTTIEIPTGPLR